MSILTYAPMVVDLFKEAYLYAKSNTTCRKVPVGALFLTHDSNKYLSCNKSKDINCIDLGECYKAKITGIYESCEETRKYCKAIHAEINIIDILKENNINPGGGILYVTRYPCYNCAANIVDYGIKHTRYCGRQEISNEVKELFNSHNVICEWIPELDFEY